MKERFYVNVLYTNGKSEDCSKGTVISKRILKTWYEISDNWYFEDTTDYNLINIH